jgi:DNA-binding response OmpR family regulator
MHVLITDDDIHLANLFAARLELEGLSVDVAYDGAAALRLAEQRLPDIAILDIGMPQMDGLELCRRLRELAGERPMKVIALTGRSLVEDRQDSAEVGFDQHWVKPLSPDLLVGLLRGEVRRMGFPDVLDRPLQAPGKPD